MKTIEQSAHVSTTARVRLRASFSDAMRAWFAGEFEKCLTLCDRVRVGDADMASRLSLLQARALSRLRRYDEVRRVINDAFVAHDTLDASLTAQMLLGMAETALGDPGRGIARLERARAASSTAHPTVRSEIALRLAWARYTLDEIDAADALFEGIDENADIISALALSYRGWIATRRGQHDRARAMFLGVLDRLDVCRQQDRSLEANMLQALSHLAAEQIDAPLWRQIENRAARLDWSADGLALPHYWLHMNAALIAEWSGEGMRALKLARLAVDMAPTPAYRALAICRRASISRGLSETWTPVDDVDGARAIFDALDPESLQGDERTVPLVLAEELSHSDVLGAARYFEMHRRMAPMDRVYAMAVDERSVAREALVGAMIADAAGDRAAAHDGYRRAFEKYRRLGYVRRASMCAIGRGRLTGESAMYGYVAKALRDTSRSYWMRREITDRERLWTDRVAAVLTDINREVLMLIVVDGLGYREIGKRVGRSEDRVKKIASLLCEAFGVADREQLVIACLARGIGRPPE